MIKQRVNARKSFSYGGIGDKAASVARFVGKSTANVTMFSAEIGVDVVKNLPEHMNRKVEEVSAAENKTRQLAGFLYLVKRPAVRFRESTLLRIRPVAI